MTLRRKLLAALAVVGLGWLVVLVVWSAAPYAASFDDAYYYFTIGRNWANGHASTFDLLDRTNGYHPLWQLVSIVPYALGLDGTAAVRTLLVTQLALWLGAWWLVIDHVSEAVDGWPALGEDRAAKRWCEGAMVVVLVALAANPFVFKMVVNGLESGLVVPVGALLCWWSIRFRGRFVSRASRRQRLLGGALLALAFLSRTDAVILIAAVGASCLLDGGTRRAPVPLARRALRTAELLAIPAVVIGAYLVANQVWFDTPLQISGTVKRLPLTPARVVLALVWAAVACAVLVLARRPVRAGSKARRVRRFLSDTSWYAAFCVGLLGYYSTLQSVPYLWYFAPLALEGTWVALLFAADLAEGAIADARAESAAEAPLPLSARLPVAILAVPFVVALVWSIGSYVDPGARALMVHDAATGRWIDHNLPASARVASWDAGVIGYFSNRRVVNLDGVVNSKAYYDAAQAGRVDEFLNARGIRWVANHGGDVNGRDPGIDKLIRSYFGPDAARHIVVVHRDLYDYTGSLDGSRTDTSSKRMGTYVYRLAR